MTACKCRSEIRFRARCKIGPSNNEQHLRPPHQFAMGDDRHRTSFRHEIMQPAARCERRQRLQHCADVSRFMFMLLLHVLEDFLGLTLHSLIT